MRLGLGLGLSNNSSGVTSAFSVNLTGLSSDSLGSYARIGNEAGISYSITPDNGTDTVAWDDNNPNSGSDYGTGANPTSLAALSGSTLYCHVTDGADTVTKSVGVRYAPGSAAGALPDQNGWQVGVAITTVDPTGDFTLTNLTGTWSASGLPAGVSINSGTGAITGTPTGAGSGSITVTFTDQYGRTVSSGFSYAVAAGNTAPVITGVPTISGSAVEGQTLAATPASVAGSPTPTRTWQWYRNTTAISGATAINYTVQAADIGSTIKVRQTETNVAGSDFAESAATAAVTGWQITLTGVSFNGTDTISMTVNRPGTIYWMITDNATENAAAVIAGTGAIDSGNFAVTSGSNNASISYPNVTAGNHYLHIVADAATSPSPSAVDSQQYTFPSGDTTAPTIIAGSPGDDATGVAIDANPTVQFSENVQFASAGSIILYDITGAANFEVFDVAADVGSGPGKVSISGDTLTIEPTNDFANGNAYAIRFSGNPIEDLAGNDLVDVADSTTYNFTTAAVWHPSSLFGSGESGLIFDASDISTLWTDAGVTQVSAADDPVGQFDSLVNSHVADQTVASSKPLYKLDGSSNPYVDFDGTDDWLDLPNGLGFSGSQNRSVFMAGSSPSFLLGSGAGVAKRWNFRRESGGTALRIELQGSGYSSAFDSSGLDVYGCVLSGTQLQDHVLHKGLSTEAATGTTTVKTTDSSNDLGASGNNNEYEQMTLYALVAIDRALTTQEISDLKTWLASKPGITLS